MKHFVNGSERLTMHTKYIFVTGGVVSGLGKGICAASLGRLLKQRGLRVTMQKLDPYFNVDPGTMSPYQHGEVFVTEDGAETDLDLGHYERFIDENLSEYSSVSSGKVYWSVLSKEREGSFLGATVQIIPHITEEIQNHILKIADERIDVAIVEIGGTVGDIESQPYMEGIRQIAIRLGRENVLYIHVSLIVEMPGTHELKSKPTQHSVKELLSAGIQPDVLVCRTDISMTRDLKEKISLFCNIEADSVIENRTAPSLYEVPLMLADERLDEVVCRKLAISVPEADLDEWRAMVIREKQAKGTVTVALVGKYTSLHDSYISIVEALNHAGIANDVQVNIRWFDSSEVTDDNAAETFCGCDGLLVPGGFGDRGIEGMISSIRYARENDIPFLGICLGMQMAVVEFARNKALLFGAHSAEFDARSAHPVIHIMPDQKTITDKGGTMRLGKYPCRLEPDSLAYRTYETPEISERHRHRYEFNTEFREELSAAGLGISGYSPDRELVEIVELPGHTWFMGVQFHPEFKSRPNRPHPVFRSFISVLRLHETDSHESPGKPPRD